MNKVYVYGVSRNNLQVVRTLWLSEGHITIHDLIRTAYAIQRDIPEKLAIVAVDDGKELRDAFFAQLKEAPYEFVEKVGFMDFIVRNGLVLQEWD